MSKVIIFLFTNYFKSTNKDEKGLEKDFEKIKTEKWRNLNKLEKMEFLPILSYLLILYFKFCYKPTSLNK